MFDDKTMTFSLGQNREDDIKQILTIVYDALKEKGYNPINQIVGYILSEDPTYITNYNNARTLIRKLDRDELLRLKQISGLADLFANREFSIPDEVAPTETERKTL